MSERIESPLDFKEIGKRVRFQREALNLSREQLAEKINISNKFCADIECGVRGMSMQTMARLSRALNVSIDFLVMGKSSRIEFSKDENGELLENIIAPLYCCNEHQLRKAGELVRIFAEALRGE